MRRPFNKLLGKESESFPQGKDGGLGVSPQNVLSPFQKRKWERGMVESVIKHSRTPFLDPIFDAMLT